jgi:hypothetical protein
LRYPKKAIRIDEEEKHDTVRVSGGPKIDPVSFSIHVNNFALEKDITSDTDRMGTFAGKSTVDVNGYAATRYTWNHRNGDAITHAYIIRESGTMYIIDDLDDYGEGVEYDMYERLRKVISTIEFTEADLSDSSNTKDEILERIKSQYTKEFVSHPAFVKEIAIGKGYNQIARRQPTEFARWDHDNDGSDHLAVLNLLYESESTDAPTGYEVLLFKLSTDNDISAPQRLVKNGTVGTYGASGSHSLQVENIKGRPGTQLHARISETPGSMGERFIDEYFVYHDNKIIPWYPGLNKLDLTFTDRFDQVNDKQSSSFFKALEGANLRFKYDGDETMGAYDSSHQTCVLQSGSCTRNLIDTFDQTKTRTITFTVVPQTARRGDLYRDGDKDRVVVVQKRGPRDAIQIFQAYRPSIILLRLKIRTGHLNFWTRFTLVTKFIT